LPREFARLCNEVTQLGHLGEPHSGGGGGGGGFIRIQ
jgi:hypothetical protein